MTRRDRWILAAIVLLAFAVRLAAVLQYEAAHPNAEHLAIDEASYDAWARAIAGGAWIGKETFFQEPLYPYSLGFLYAIAGPERLVARVAQCALWAVTALLAGLLARRLFGRAASIVAALAIALYGPGMLFPSYLLKENLLLPVFTLLAIALVSSRWLAVGLLAGLGALLRGNLLVLIPLLVLWPVLRTRGARASLRSAGLVLLGAAAILLPVAIRNAAVGGELLLTTSGAGTNLYGGNNLENPYGRATEFSFVRGIPEHEAGDWRREAERRIAAREGAARALDPGEVSAFWRDEALRSFREHPADHLAILVRKLRLALGRYEVPDNHSLAWDERYVALARAPWPAFGILGTLGIAGVVLLILGARWGERGLLAADRGAAIAVALLAAAYVATVVLTVVSDRARLPIVPLLAPFAGWILVTAFRAVRWRHAVTLVLVAISVVAAAVPVYTRVLPAAEVAEDLAERDHNLAVQLLEEGGRDREARAIAEALVREHPASARSRILLAEIEFRAGIQRRLGGEAERRFRDALAFDAESAELREGLARSLVGGSEGAGAAEARRRSEEALAILANLPPAPALQLLEAQAEFVRGQSILAGPPRDDAERAEGQRSVQSALDGLRALAGSPQTGTALRRSARTAAGGMQLVLGNFQQAENHFRAALELGEGDEARLGLLEALVGRLEKDEPAAEDRSRAIEEARSLLEDLRRTARAPARLEGLSERLSRLG